MTLRQQIFLLRTRQATWDWGTALGSLLRSGDVVALEGDLGAGKTTLTKAIGAGMGILDEVTSPTFTLMHEYRGRIPLFHLDPYRLDRPDDLADFGLDDYFAREGVLVAEWADRLDSLLPAARLTIRFDILPTADCVTGDFRPDVASAGQSLEDEPRRITVLATDSRYEEILATLLKQPKVSAMIERESGC